MAGSLYDEALRVGHLQLIAWDHLRGRRAVDGDGDGVHVDAVYRLLDDGVAEPRGHHAVQHKGRGDGPQRPLGPHARRQRHRPLAHGDGLDAAARPRDVDARRLQAVPREVVVRTAHEHERRSRRALEGFGGRDRGVEFNRDPAPGRLGLHELVGDLGDGDVVVNERQARAHAARPLLSGAFAHRGCRVAE